MDKFRSIYLPLSKEEFIALQLQAISEKRHPRDEARMIIRRALLGDSGPVNSNTGAIRQDKHAGVA